MTIADAVTRSHTVATRVEVLDGPNLVATLYPVAGSVTVDAARAIRRTCSLTFADYDGTLTPTHPGALLAPGAYELRISRGIVTDEGDLLHPLGVFTVSGVDVDADGDGVTITVTGEDRARILRERPWTRPRVLATATNIGTVLAGLVNDAAMLPDVPTNIDTTTAVTPNTHAITIGAGLTADPWSDLEVIALAAGFEVWFDNQGTFRAGAHPSVVELTESDAVRVFEAGTGSTLLGVSRSLTAQGITNGVRVTAEGSGIPLDGGSVPSGEALDSNAASPTYVGQLGTRLEAISTPMVGTSAAAQDMAERLLPRYVGWPVTVTIVPDPTLDARDVVWVRDPRVGVDGPVVVDAVDIPLEAGAGMSLTGRLVRV